MFLKVLDTPQSVCVWGLPMSVVHSMSLVQGLDKGDLLQYPIVHPFSKQWRKHCPGIIVWLSVWKFGSQPSRDRMTSTPLILGTKVACWPQYLASGARFATQLIVWRVCRRSAKKMQKRGVNGINQRRSGTGWAQALVKRWSRRFWRPNNSNHSGVIHISISQHQEWYLHKIS